MIDLITHADAYLFSFIQNWGYLAVPLLFAIIFLETGLIIAPFLPGDSLLFITGFFIGANVLPPYAAAAILVAAILGDTVNYTIGKALGRSALTSSKMAIWIKKEYIVATENFFATYGKKAIILARFLPIIRTLAPCLAGIGKMEYHTFMTYNVIGAFAWTVLFIGGGAIFGKIPWVQAHVALITGMIIAVTVLISMVEFFRMRRKSDAAKKAS